MTRSTRTAARPGFTLVELMVVIAIVVILLTITGVAVQKTLDSQKNRSSKEQMYKLQQSLDSEYERVRAQCEKDRRSKQIPPVVVTYCDGNDDRAQAVWTALQLRRQFPETFAEATQPTPLDTATTLQPMATFAEARLIGSAATPSAPHPDESAVLLYIILAKKSVAGGGAMTAAADDLSSAMKKTVTIDGKQFETFADAWGNSIGFRRWFGSKAANLAEAEVQEAPYGVPGQVNPNNRDPLDPRNLVRGWPDTTKRTAMEGLGFLGRNRMATVYSVGKTAVHDTTGLPTPDDDLLGFRLRKFGE